ncbi:Dolichyl-diphosphooligosaccharide-protein glycosyltransferase subunit dad1 [Rhizophlyctis rosea]|uniref:Dolichyl-diphosphooligosaccharide--protein glycosyltransferase subunit OST2 n=1 Tax=Rhizophlyctis rosea TaxID=64517 RepID=A0AAD5SH85_9FUNG|nr:Dolichyl-diphosphooligosaccharide-protein glycosyltransferase subunit dad1 [Rhizophlyctis rosea]
MAKKNAAQTPSTPASSSKKHVTPATPATPAAATAAALSSAASTVAASTSNAASSQVDLISRLLSSYNKETPQSLKIIDAYLVFVMLTGIIQFVYVILAGTFPYNSFLAGFIASVGTFVLAANLRIQVNPKNTEFKHLSPERAFADYLFSSIIFYAFVVNFLG